MKNFIQKGGAVQVTLTEAVSSGDVVKLSHCLGVAVTDGGIGDTIAVEIEGVFEVPKVTGIAFLQGEKLMWDYSASKFTGAYATPASGDVTGAAIALQSAVQDDTTCIAKLTPGNADLQGL